MFIFRKATNLFKKSAKLALAKTTTDKKLENTDKKGKVQVIKSIKKSKSSLKQDEKENNQE